MPFNRLKFCKCNECMLEGKKIVPSSGEVVNKIAIIGAMPHIKEETAFSDSHSYFMNEHLSRVGISRYETYTLNLVQCNVPGNGLDRLEGQSAIECCQEGFEEELKWLAEQGVKVLVPMSDKALQMLGIDEKLFIARGSVYYKEPFIVIPTYSPAKISTMRHEIITWLNDFNKALEYTTKAYTAPVENFNCFPTIEEIEAFTEEVTSKKLLIAVDTETTKLDPQLGQIVVTGMATDGENCISFPKYNKNGYEYWKNGDRLRATDCLQKILLECPLAFQNAMYDCYWFMEKGFKIGHIKHDTMLLHALINPELPHKLEYINSIYGTGPAWKSEYSSHKIPILSKDEKLVRTYNSRDCTVLHQCLPAMIEDAKDVLHIYEYISLKLIKPLLEMQLTGLRVDKKALAKWKKELTTEIEELSIQMRKVALLPDEFNLNSIQHLSILLFNKLPGWVKKSALELATYEERDCKKRKDTIKYKELLAKVKLIRDIQPFEFPKGLVPKRTQGNAYSTDDEALVRFKLASLKRLEVVKNLKRYLPTHALEEAGLFLNVKFTNLLQRYRKLTKLLSTYTEFPIMPDNKVHGKFKIFGTTTGRLSSNNPNLQNIPPVAKKIFIPEEEMIFLQADFSNLEARVLAYIAEDDVLQDIFNQGLNLHDVNTRKLFSIEPDNSRWKILRRVAKTYIFGRNYGGGLQGMYKRIATEVEDFDMTFAEFKRMDTKYFAAHPKYKEWMENLKSEVTQKRELTNIFGRKRIFLGNLSNVLREALNFPIQSAAGDIMSKGMIDVYEHRDEAPPFKLTITVHDSLVVQCLPKDVPEIVSYLKKYLEQEHMIMGEEVSFPVDFEVGYNYKDMISLEDWKEKG